jgi:predicted ribosome quality control (RQC) complex YloA/Tae2 family protein
MGPLTLVDGEIDEDDIVLAARLTARFSQGRQAKSVRVEVTRQDGSSRRMDIAPLSSAEVSRDWYL